MRKSGLYSVLFMGLVIAANAAIIGPYEVDAYTLQLWHLDDTAAPAVNAVNTTHNMKGLLNNATLGNASYGGFGTALNTNVLGATATHYGILHYATALSSSTSADTPTTFQYHGADGAFTIEAIVKFAPTRVASALTQSMTIVSHEGDGNGTQDRNWTFRVVSNTDGTPKALDFNALRSTAGGYVQVALPTSGDNAPNTTDWFHVALVYDGNVNTDGNLKFYWTKMNPALSQANLLGSGKTCTAGEFNYASNQGDFAIGNEARSSGGETENFSGLIDEVRISSVARAANQMMFGNRTTAWNPTPSNGAIDVPLAQVLSWSAPTDPTLDPGYTVQYAVYMDPNQTKVNSGTGCTYTRTLNPSTSFDPTPDMAYQTKYYWRVDAQVKFTGQTDPNVIKGDIWSLTTASSLPSNVTNPVNTKVDEGQTAQFTVTFSSDSPVAAVWFKDSVALNPLTDPDLTITTDDTSSVLSIANVAAKYEGTYYCELTNDGGKVSSGSAALAIKKVLAWYQFENNLNDSAGTSHGSLVGPAGGMTYSTTDLPGTISGQTYSADPNGGVYVQLSTDAYPKTGFGNGLEESTVSYWVKIAPDAFGSIYGNYNGTPGTTEPKTGTRTRVDNAGKVHFHIRNETGGQAEPISNKTVDDNQWHFVTAVVTSAGITLYVDVTDKVTVASSFATGTFAAWQYPMVLMAMNNRTAVQDMFPGLVDDLKITNYAITQTEIAQMYYDVTGKGSCIQTYASTYDYNGNCKVEMADFAVLAREWLKCGLYPDCN